MKIKAQYRLTSDRGMRYFESISDVVEFLDMSRGESEKTIVEKLDSEGLIMERSDLSTVYNRNSVV